MKALVGDIFKSKAQTLVNTVNCVGIMGKGIALEFKKQFPEMFEDYSRRCERGEVRLGEPYIFKALIPPHIINFPTKGHWRAISRIADVEKGLKYLVENYKEWGVTSIALPPLGCGNGQLDWKDIGPLIYRYASKMDIPVELFAPYNTSPNELTSAFLSCGNGTSKPLNGRSTALRPEAAWVALVEILDRIEKQPYHWPVGRIIFQKIAFVASHYGLPTGFEYKKDSFGPFSRELKFVTSNLANNNLIQEERIGQMFEVKVGPNFERVRKDYEKNFGDWNEIIERTTDLFMRLNTRQAEIVATVMFSAAMLRKKQKKKPTEVEVLQAIQEWKQRRRPPLDEKEVASTIRNLATFRWLDVEYDANLPVPDEDQAFA